jgi:16S rRNA (uracil1498-N3)-methyltransferase
MHRFYLPPEQCKDTTLFLRGREAHHALRVLRLRSGEHLTVLDGAGHQFFCEVQQFDRDKMKLAVLEKRFVEPLPHQITLVQAVPKGKIIESIIQKATELGTACIVPLLSERVSIQLNSKDAARKAETWHLLAIEALKQCGSASLRKVEPPVTIEHFLARKEKVDLSLIASLQSDSRPARVHFQAFQAEHGQLPRSIRVWIGPEGDFTPAEISAIQHTGALPITLGPLVLRTETAAVYCLSILNYELQSAAPRD